MMDPGYYIANWLVSCVPLSAICFPDKSSGFVIAIVTPSASWGNKIGSRSHKLPALRAEVANSSWVTIAMKDNFSKLSCHSERDCCCFFPSHEFNSATSFFSPMSINKTQQDLCILGKLFFGCFHEIASFDVTDHLISDLNSMLVSHYLILIPTQNLRFNETFEFLSLQELHTWTFGLCFPVNRWELGIAIKAWTYPSRSWRLAAKKSNR